MQETNTNPASRNAIAKTGSPIVLAQERVIAFRDGGVMELSNFSVSATIDSALSRTRLLPQVPTVLVIYWRPGYASDWP
jgi:hypothetical protein